MGDDARPNYLLNQLQTMSFASPQTATAATGGVLGSAAPSAT